MNFDINKHFIRQITGYGLGNFVCATPTIRCLSKYYKTKINVFFTYPFVQEMYEDCAEINAIDSFEGLRQMFTTSLVNGGVPDYEYIYTKIVKNGLRLDCPIEEPFVAEYLSEDPSEYAVIAYGCANKSVFKGRKTVGPEIYNHILDKINMKVYFVGSTADYNERLCTVQGTAHGNLVLDQPKRILGIINGARFVISNDCGLYHVSSALKKPVFTIWKDTPLEKNRVPNKDTFISLKDNWYNDFERWFEQWKN